MSNPISHFFRWLVCSITLISTVVVLTPYNVLRIIIDKKVPHGPNRLQMYLTWVVKRYIIAVTITGARPAPNTRTPSKLRDFFLRRKFTWIEPAPYKTTQSPKNQSSLESNKELLPSFDDSFLPVSLEGSVPKRIAGLWFLNPKETGGPPTAEKRRNSPVLLYFHGGAYISFDAGDPFLGITLARLQAKHANVDVLSINYRLAPESKYPVQLFEAYSAYKHVVEVLGYATSNVFIGGDSAGANLALLLWRYLHAQKVQKPVAGLVLHSPWLDIQGWQRKGFEENERKCILHKGFTKKGFSALQRNNLPLVTDSWINPIQWKKDNPELLSNLCPVFISNGGVECLLEEAVEFIDALKNAHGDVKHVVEPGCPHDYLALFYYFSAIHSTFSELGDWIREKSSSGEA